MPGVTDEDIRDSPLNGLSPWQNGNYRSQRGRSTDVMGSSKGSGGSVLNSSCWFDVQGSELAGHTIWSPWERTRQGARSSWVYTDGL